MSAQMWIPPITTLVDAVNTRINTKNGELAVNLADRAEDAITQDRAYLGILNDMLAELANVHRAFHRSAIVRFVEHGEARHLRTTPRTYVHHIEITAERQAHAWLSWLIS